MRLGRESCRVTLGGRVLFSYRPPKQAGAREIPLTRGLVALVDAADYDRVAAFRWFAVPRRDGRTFYAHGTVPVDGRARRMSMHRFLTNCPSGLVVDHINGRGLDNRRANLRICTTLQNNYNRRVSTCSAFRGVQQAASGRWRAKISIDGKHVHIGTFATAEDAARAYDAHAVALRGEFALLNFPEERPRPARIRGPDGRWKKSAPAL